MEEVKYPDLLNWRNEDRDPFRRGIMLVTTGKHDLEANQVADVGYLVHT